MLFTIPNADSASSSSSLDSSIHAPPNNNNSSNNSKGKQKDLSNNSTIIQTLAKAMDRLEFLSNQLSVWQLAIKNLDKRTNRIENFLQLAPLETDNQSSPPTSLNNTSSSINENTAVVTNNNANSTSSDVIKLTIYALNEINSHPTI